MVNDNLDSKVVIQAALDAVIQSVPSSVSYYSQDKLELKAAIVNSYKDVLYWKEKLLKTNGNKFLKKIGFTGENAIFFQLAKEVADGNAISNIKYENMKCAILEVAVSGEKSLLTIEQAKNIICAADNLAYGVNKKQ